MDDANRPNGFYWVFRNDTWEPAQWTGCEWYEIGDRNFFDTKDFEIIGDRILPPNKP